MACRSARHPGSGAQHSAQRLPVGDELQAQLVPEVGRCPVVAERPHPGPAQVHAVHQVVLEPERIGIVVVQLAVGAVVGLAGVAARRAPPGGPGRSRRYVPVMPLLERTGKVRKHSSIGIRHAAAVRLCVGSGAGAWVGSGRPLVAVVGHPEHHFGGGRLGQVLVDFRGVVVGPAVERRGRSRVPRRVRLRGVVRHDEKRIHVR